jgi:hypothetical protein
VRDSNDAARQQPTTGPPRPWLPPIRMARIRSSEERRHASKAEQEAAWTRLEREQQRHAIGEAALEMLAEAVAALLAPSIDLRNEPHSGRTETATKDGSEHCRSDGEYPRPEQE